MAKHRRKNGSKKTRKNGAKSRRRRNDVGAATKAMASRGPMAKSKKPRTAAQKAATKRMIAANRKKKGGKKSTTTAKGRRASHHVGTHREQTAGHRKSLRTRAKSLRAAAKKIGKRAKGTPNERKYTTARILRLRASALSLRARSMGKTSSKKNKKGVTVLRGLSSQQRKMLEAHGLVKVNPSIMGIVKDMAMLLPTAGITVAVMAGAAIAAQKASSKLPASTPEFLKGAHGKALLSLGVGSIGYIIARFIGAGAGSVATLVNKVAPGIFVGGVAGAVLHELTGTKVAGPEASPGVPGPTISLAAKIGLPIGNMYEYVGDYVMGDYVMGDYVMGGQRPRMLAGVGAAGIFKGGMLGAMQREMMVGGRELRLNGVNSAADAREGNRGRSGETDLSDLYAVAKENGLLDHADYEGSLEGGIFD